MNLKITNTGFDELALAAAIRSRKNLCWHSDDLRLYADRDEAEADRMPGTICPECGLRKLVMKAVALDAGADLEKLALDVRDGLRNYLR